jgi:hypothetical protein
LARIFDHAEKFRYWNTIAAALATPAQLRVGAPNRMVRLDDSMPRFSAVGVE